MTNKEAIVVLTQHLHHWERLLENKICTKKEGEETIEALKMAIEELEESPTGEWIGDTDYESYQGCYEAYKCSNCNYGLHWRDYISFAKDYNYCPNCGAKMKGGEGNEG